MNMNGADKALRKATVLRHEVTRRTVAWQRSIREEKIVNMIDYVEKDKEKAEMDLHEAITVYREFCEGRATVIGDY
jgi:hypothetical protein